MIILSSVSSILEFWSVRHASIHGSYESNVFKNIKFLSEVSNN